MSISKPHVVLVVEDEALLLMMMEETLKEAGFHVMGVAAGEAAVAAAAEHPPDLLVLNLRISGELYGVTLLSQLRAMARVPLPAILVTGFTLTDEEHDSYNGAGGGPAVAVLTKPFLPADLVEAARTRLGSP